MPTFIYATVNAGKTLEMLKTAHMYKERGKRIAIVKSALDTRYPGNIVGTRIGLEQEANFILPCSREKDTFARHLRSYPDALFMDEAQFLLKEQVYELQELADNFGIEVFCYGLRTTYTNEPFEGSSYLLSIAKNVREIPTICFCGNKAVINARIENGRIVYLGEPVKIDKEEEREQGNFYTALCWHHWKLGVFDKNHLIA